MKTQKIYLVESKNKDILLRGTNLDLNTAKAVAGDYLPQVVNIREVRGYEALAYALSTTTYDLQDDLQK
jgi:hypothetical protein